MNENPAYVCICGIFFVPLRRKRRKQTNIWIAEHISYRFLTSMQLVGIYSDVERDPRGRVITAAYAAMTTMPEATAADDAAAAQWRPLNALPKLAFDHETILRDAKRVMNIKD